MTEQSYCLWTVHDTPDGDVWHTDCGHLNQFIADGPKENGYEFCPYCGHRLVIDDETQNHD